MATTETSYVQQKWTEITAGIDTNIQEKWWKCIEQQYSEASRKYHTFVHLHQMLRHLDEHKDEIDCLEAVAFAIIFHDIAYDVSSQENEENSFKLFTEFAEESGIIQKILDFMAPINRA